MEKATPSTLPGCCAKKEAKRKLVVASSSFAEKFRTPPPCQGVGEMVEVVFGKE